MIGGYRPGAAGLQTIGDGCIGRDNQTADFQPVPGAAHGKGGSGLGQSIGRMLRIQKVNTDIFTSKKRQGPDLEEAPALIINAGFTDLDDRGGISQTFGIKRDHNLTHLAPW